MSMKKYLSEAWKLAMGTSIVIFILHMSEKNEGIPIGGISWWFFTLILFAISALYDGGEKHVV